MGNVSLYTVRQLSTEDADRCVELGRVMHKTSVYAFLPFSEDKARMLAIRCANDPNHFGVVVEREGVVVGMLGAYVTEYYFSTAKIVQDLLVFVEPTRRGGAAAMLLISALLDWAKQAGASEVCLGVTAGINNAAAEKLYEHVGFARIGSIFKKRV